MPLDPCISAAQRIIAPPAHKRTRVVRVAFLAIPPRLVPLCAQHQHTELRLAPGDSISTAVHWRLAWCSLDASLLVSPVYKNRKYTCTGLRIITDEHSQLPSLSPPSAVVQWMLVDGNDRFSRESADQVTSCLLHGYLPVAVHIRDSLAVFTECFSGSWIGACAQLFTDLYSLLQSTQIIQPSVFAAVVLFRVHSDYDNSVKP